MTSRYPYVREVLAWLKERDPNALLFVDGPAKPCIVVMEEPNGAEFNTDRVERD